MIYAVSLLCGAGASLPFGVPVMSGFYKEFRDYISTRRAHCYSIIEDIETNIEDFRPDLEILLSSLESIIQTERGAELIGLSDTNLAKKVELAKELRGYFDAFVIERCERFNREKASAEYAQLLSLVAAGPLWIFTTNYDRIIEFACVENDVDFDDGFVGDSGQPVFNWEKRFTAKVRIGKLHGSVNWYEDDPGGALHRLDRGYPLPGFDFRLVRGDQTLKPLMIIPTLEKGVLRDPYATLSIMFSDVLRETHLLIIIGHSLRDEHIRNYIKTRLDTLNILLVSPRASIMREVFGSAGMVYTIDAGFSEFVQAGGTLLADLAQSLAKLDFPKGEVVGRMTKEFVENVSARISEIASAEADPKIATYMRQLMDERQSARIPAVGELAKFPRTEVIEKLAFQLDTDPSIPVRTACIDALHSVGDAASIAAIGRALNKDGARLVQQEAALALKSFLPNEAAQRFLQSARQRFADAPGVLNILEENGAADEA